MSETLHLLVVLQPFEVEFEGLDMQFSFMGYEFRLMVQTTLGMKDAFQEKGKQKQIAAG